MKVSIEKAILHWVPMTSAGTSGSAVVLTDTEAPLELEQRRFLEKKIQGSLNSRYSYPAVLDSEVSSPIPTHIAEFLSEPTTEKLVAHSREWATHLYSCQPGNSPSGLLMVAQCRCDNYDLAIATVKLEQEEGVRAKLQNVESGGTTYVMQLLDDLVLTNKTKVFKVGLFYDVAGTIEGLVSDHQMGFNPKREVARFFLTRFLGARLKVDSEVATRRFIDTVCNFVNKEVTNPKDRMRVYTHLVSEMTDEKEYLSPADFVRDHIPSQHQDNLLNYLREKEVPINLIEKSEAVIASRLKKMMVEFQSGIRILGPSDVFREKVHLKEIEDGLTRAEVTDELKRVGRQ